jgi:hypothetical protein
MIAKSQQDEVEVKQHMQNLANMARRNSYLDDKGININQPVVMQDLFPNTLFDNHRVLPNDFARSCLFTARHPKTQRKYLHSENLFHINKNIEILYTGQELRAVDDELIWMQLVHYCLKSPLSSYVEFKVRKLIQDIGWKETGAYYQKVRESLSRMKATEIFVKNSSAYGLSAGISLINNYVASGNSSDSQPTIYNISIDKSLIILFAGNTFTNLPWEKYKKLSTTTRRLADYALSHKYPNPIDIVSFLKMCGSDRVYSPPKTRTTAAERCCKEIVKAGLVKEAFINKGKIVILR